MGGFFLSKTQTASDYVGKVQTFHVASGHATVLAQGDLVVLTGTAHTDGTAQVDAAAAGGLITGVIVGFKPNIAALETKGLPDGTAGYVFVQTDAMALYETSVITTALEVTDVGMNYDVVATAASTSGSLVTSNMQIDGAFTGVAATAQMRIVGLIPISGVTLGAVGYRNVICRINESTEKGTVGVAG